MKPLLLLLLFSMSTAKSCVRFLPLNETERRALKAVSGRVWRWNKNSRRFEHLEAMTRNFSALCSVNMSDRIKGQTLIVSADIMQPYIGLKDNNTGVTGYIGEVWTILEQALKFKTIYRRAGPSPSRTLMNGTAHALLLPTAIHAYASSYYTYSTAVATNYYALFVQSEGTIVSKWWYASIFSRGLWLTSFIFVLCLTALIMGAYALKKALLLNYTECDDELASPSFSLLHVLGGISGQGFPKLPTSWSMRLLIATYLTMGMLLSCGFSSTLTSYLAIKATSVPLSSLEDIQQKRTHSLCMRNDSGAYIRFSTRGKIKRNLLPEWERIVNKGCPDMTNVASLGPKLCQPGLVYLEAPDLFLAVYRPVRHKCRIVQIPEKYWNLKVAFLHNRGSEYRHIIDKWLMRLRSAGILKYLESKYISKSIELPTTQWSDFHAVEYGHICLAIVGLLMMIALSVAICILEILFYNHQTKQGKKKIIFPKGKCPNFRRIKYKKKIKEIHFLYENPLTVRKIIRK